MLTIKPLVKNWVILFLPALFFSAVTRAQIPAGIQQEINSNNRLAEKSIGEGNLAEAARYFNQSAYVLRNNQLNEEAIPYYERILEINKQLNNQKGILLTCNNLGMVFLDLERYDKALAYLEKGLELSRKTDTKEAVISAISNVAVALQGLGRYQESNKRIDEAIQMAKDINNLKLLRRGYGIMYENYDKLGQSDKSYQYFELYSSLDKEIKKREMKQVKQEAETEVRQIHAEKQLTETELSIKKQELEITADSLVKAEKLTREQQLEIELKNAELGEKDALIKLKNFRIKVITYGLVVLFVFLIALTLLLIKLRIANKKIVDQRDILDRQNKNITASIRYAMTIQQAMLPDELSLSKIFDSFIIYQPKDIVSGDFYWFSGFDERKNGYAKNFVAVVDCTGHGVPGAFMSMIGNRLLNEIVIEKKVEDPKEVLELLNEEIRIALRQEQTDNNDGMDISFCLFEKQKSGNLKLVFSGAKRVVYIANKKSDDVISLKGERKSIGGLGEKKEQLKFTNQEIEIQNDDIIYLSTDGLIDQNGPDRKRYGSKRFEDLIAAVKNHPLDQQKESILNDISEYSQGEEQRDDITIIGLKVK